MILSMLCLCTIIACFSSYFVKALSLSSGEEITIQADFATIDEAKGMVVYEGNVILLQGAFTLKGKMIRAKSDDDNVTSFFANGNPAFFSQQRKSSDKQYVEGRATQISYHSKDKKIILKGNASISLGDSEFAGDDISYFLETGKMAAKGTKEDRVKMKMKPDAINE